MTTETEVTLKPCPFCGPGELQTFRVGSLYFVQCLSCDAERTGRTEAEATTAWNTREAEKRTAPRENVFSLSDLKQAFGAGFSSGEDYCDNEAPERAFRRPDAWERYACTLGDRNTVAVKRTAPRSVVEAAERLLSAYDARTTTAQQIVTGHSDRDLKAEAQKALDDLRAALASLTTDDALVEETKQLAELIRTRLLGIAPDEQDVVLDDSDWRTILRVLGDV